MLFHRILIVPRLPGACFSRAAPTTSRGQTFQPTKLDRVGVAVQQGEPDDPVALARSVPGFGGFFVDEQGTPTIYLRDAAQRGTAERALTPWFGAQGRAPATMRVRKADFDWAALDRWFTQASVEALGIPGVVFADADEASNRVRIGVEHVRLRRGSEVCSPGWAFRPRP